MRKRIIDATTPASAVAEKQSWIDLSAEAQVELSSEDPEHGIEKALVLSGVGGWKAAVPGRQTIRLTFDKPRDVHRIRLEFAEREIERSQEFALHVAGRDGELRELRRQQWTFSPQGSVDEVEEYAVDLHNVSGLQLTIDPDRGRDRVPATLERWLVA